MSLLEVDNVVVGYGDTEVLHGVSISVHSNEFVTIIGPNGSGKSTSRERHCSIRNIRVDC